MSYSNDTGSCLVCEMMLDLHCEQQLQLVCETSCLFYAASVLLVLCQQPLMDNGWVPYHALFLHPLQAPGCMQPWPDCTTWLFFTTRERLAGDDT